MRTVIRKAPVLVDQGAGSQGKGVLVKVVRGRAVLPRAVPVRGDPRRPVPGRGVLQVLEVPDLRGQIRTQVWTK